MEQKRKTDDGMTIVWQSSEFAKNDITLCYDLFETVARKMKKRKSIVSKNHYVTDYEEAVRLIANYLNSYLEYMVTLPTDYPDLIVLAWHYANTEFGFPAADKDYMSFIHTLGVDVRKKMTERSKKYVSMKQWYNNQKKNNAK